MRSDRDSSRSCSSFFRSSLTDTPYSHGARCAKPTVCNIQRSPTEAPPLSRVWPERRQGAERAGDTETSGILPFESANPHLTQGGPANDARRKQRPASCHSKFLPPKCLAHRKTTSGILPFEVLLGRLPSNKGMRQQLAIDPLCSDRH